MIIDKKTIERLHREGVKFTGTNGEPIKPQPIVTPRREATELDQLRAITGLLQELVSKPAPIQTVATVQPPDVIVNPPEIRVNVPEINVPPTPPRIRKWKFYIERDFSGHATEITATAVE
jgi:hypothetical protein